MKASQALAPWWRKGWDEGAWMRRRCLVRVVALSLVLVVSSVGLAGSGWAASAVSQTKHNFSASGWAQGNAIADPNQQQICVFCHTPHGATQGAVPLWNKSLPSPTTYTPYSSSSITATDLSFPNGSSQLCLSCHDGTVAIGKVNVVSGQSNVTLSVTGTGPGGVMPAGPSNLGTNLTADHPISFTYNTTVANNNTELQDPSTSNALIANASLNPKPTFPLQGGLLQCTSCHDPHSTSAKFLRGNMLQQTVGPSTGTPFVFSAANDIMCLACHRKPSWPRSAHGSTDASIPAETYTDTAATANEFPTGTATWQAACLNCHTPHAQPGASRLIRNGTPTSNACFACHAQTGNTKGAALQNQGTANFPVPDVKTDFTSTYHMPLDNNPSQDDPGNITNNNPPIVPTAGKGADMLLSQTLLRKQNVTCIDCHNPHRVIKNRLADGSYLPSPSGTHPLNSFSSPTNVASGVLRGAWGVEAYTTPSATFGIPVTSFTIKRGDPGQTSFFTGSVPINQNFTNYLTREYQICLKCHSYYTWGLASNFPYLGGYLGATPANTNAVAQFTDQAMEFYAPSSEQGDPSMSAKQPNHRSWHPVTQNTGRSLAVRGGVNGSAGSGIFLPPWSNYVGSQTMYCSDCHGSATAAPTPTSGTVIPLGNANPQSDAAGSEDGSPWGPHGSRIPFVLKGSWDKTTGTATDALCFRCHQYSCYGQSTSGASCQSAFSKAGGGNLHHDHVQKVANYHCSLCHVSVPHGWKNRNLVVDLNKVATPENGVSAEVEVNKTTGTGFTQGPYYNDAYNKIVTWPQPGNWAQSNCGSASGLQGNQWMSGCKAAP